MLPSTSFAKLKLSELLANLAGKSNAWFTTLECAVCAVDTRDPHLFKIPTGHAT
ncbi:hypothetical protein N7455_012504 [Penicillium solitum]|uniref:uncharacterized protein n=1 Tax=Penicillium solitum TaxID=60172 RepID=UPI0032C45AA7|nr:hypothetical protein N7455_012504 [Penicillium solitum]